MAPEKLTAFTDAQLLARFCTSGEDAVFRAIVNRYKSMVFSVCTSVLANHADAEDAFQATFFVLARKASSVRNRESIAAWLHRVALRCALENLRRKKQRNSHEQPLNDKESDNAASPEELAGVSSRALVVTVHEELDKLPEKYRLPLVLCYLEGASPKEGARCLGMQESAFYKRLERARKMLRTRLMASAVFTVSLGALLRTAMAHSNVTIASQQINTTVSIAAHVKTAWAAEAAVGAGNHASLALAKGVLQTMTISTAVRSLSMAACWAALLVAIVAATSWAGVGQSSTNNSSGPVSANSAGLPDSTEPEVSILVRLEEGVPTEDANSAPQDQENPLDKFVGQRLTIEGETLGGEEFDLKDYSGKVVLVEFWASWCGPCKAEMPNIREVYEAHKDDGFAIVGISLDTTSDAAEKYLETQGIEWPNILSQVASENDAGNDIAGRLGVRAIPSSFLIDRNGKVVATNLRGGDLKTAVSVLVNVDSCPAK